MRFEKLTDKKIRIILSMKDMQLNNVSMSNIFSNSASSQKLLQSLLTMAEKEIGFETGDSKLLVEAIMTLEEECIFTITKISDKKQKLKTIQSSLIFKFDNFDDFIDLCYFIQNIPILNFKDLSKKFSLVLYNNTYYLCAFDVEDFDALFNYIKNIISEFGENVSNSSTFNGILNEYGKIIFSKNALLQCIKNFKRQL